VPSFLAETYLPRAGAASMEETAHRARAAARELTERGIPIRFVRSIFVPDDEISFFIFDAISARVVEAACTRAGLRFERVVEAIESRPRRSESAEAPALKPARAKRRQT
jgi:hypothetical protein